MMRKPSYHSSDDAWFLEKLKSMTLASDELDSHPTRAILHAYLHNRLPDRWLSLEELRADSHRWTLTTVSQHVLVCPSCQSEISQMRRAQLQNRREEMVLQIGSPQAVSLHLRGFALVAAILLLLNGALLMLFPAPGGEFTPCSTLVKGIHYKGDGAERSGPPIVEEYSSKLCWSASSSQTWQTWWAPVVMGLWLPFLLWHLLWVWAGSAEVRRQREWA
jgi:hypothetical protein